MSDRKDHWARINSLFDEAARLPGNERLLWLKKACGESEELIDEVLSLLEHDVEQTGKIRPKLGRGHRLISPAY